MQYDITYMCNIKNNNANNICKTETDLQIKKTN